MFYLVHKRLTPVPLLSYINLAQTTKLFLNVHIYITFPSTFRSTKQFLFLKLPNQNPIFTSPFPRTCTCTAHLILFLFITPIVYGVMDYLAPRNAVSATPPSLLDPSIFLSTMFTDTLSLFCSIKMTDQITHPLKRTLCS